MVRKTAVNEKCCLELIPRIRRGEKKCRLALIDMIAVTKKERENSIVFK